MNDMTTLVLESADLNECLAAFNELKPEDRLSMSAYDLAELTEIDNYERWINFLKHPAIAQKMEEEVNLYIVSQQRKLMQTATIDDKSVGKAQLIQAMQKAANDDRGSQSGNIFVYNYIPLNKNEAKRPNVKVEDYDIMDTD